MAKRKSSKDYFGLCKVVSIILAILHGFLALSLDLVKARLLQHLFASFSASQSFGLLT